MEVAVSKTDPENKIILSKINVNFRQNIFVLGIPFFRQILPIFSLGEKDPETKNILSKINVNFRQKIFVLGIRFIDRHLHITERARFERT